MYQSGVEEDKAGCDYQKNEFDLIHWKSVKYTWFKTKFASRKTN